MYSIIKKTDGKFLCSCVIQDGTEEWEKETLEKAVSSMISNAYYYNGVRINKEMINFSEEKPKKSPTIILESEIKLIEEIRSKRKVILDYDDFRIKANLLKEEVEIIYALREGRVKIENNF